MLNQIEHKVLETDLDCPPNHRKVKLPELHKNFEEFWAWEFKWIYRNEFSKDFSVVPVFYLKPSCKPPLGDCNMQVFLSQVESEIFKENQNSLHYFKISKKEWRALRSLAKGRSIFIKKADKGSCVAMWDRWDCIKVTEKQLVNSTFP